MKRPLFDIWEDMNDIGPTPWRVQLVNYIGHFTTQAKAESFVETTKKLREQVAKSVK